MRVAIVSINYTPELTGISVYTTGMAEHLHRAGAKVHCYTGFSYYPQWKKAACDRRKVYRREQREGVNVLRHYVYVPGRPSTLRRIGHELSFICSVSVGYLLGPRADCTVIVSPPLLLGLPIAVLAKLKRSKVVFHVQDLQPDAAVELGMLPRGRLTQLLYSIERLSYRMADQVSSISRAMLDRIAAKGIARDKLLLFPNWANDEEITPQPRTTAYRREWGLDDSFVVLYAGNLGVKQGLHSLIDCAAALQHCAGMVFVIVGDGGEKPALVEEVARRQLTNVLFKPLQPSNRLSDLLATADVCVVPQRHGPSDIALPSKLANIMASGRALVAAAQEKTEVARILSESGCGITVAPGNGIEMADAIRRLELDPELRARMSEAGRRYVEEHFSARVVLRRFEASLRTLADARGRGEVASERV